MQTEGIKMALALPITRLFWTKRCVTLEYIGPLDKDKNNSRIVRLMHSGTFELTQKDIRSILILFYMKNLRKYPIDSETVKILKNEMGHFET
ncbi:MAG: hypothetical protein IPJ13_32580 [Saprospiraceae bacterium]|nr:hypothetical protein [Saprospiraceae bacterium]